MSESLFVYGTLMNPLVQQRVFGRTAVGKADKLVGYKKDLIYLGSGVYPIIKPEAGSSVEGMVIEVTQAELKLIDWYEGKVYQRKKARLASGQPAWVYAEQ
jgi:gamma-glutamylcyclotransferase (GGCT)/AIG2-like uncharacterized protein YtfP